MESTSMVVTQDDAMEHMQDHPLSFVIGVINHHYLFHDSLEECLECLEEVLAGVEIRNALANGRAKAERDLYAATKRVRRLLPPKRRDAVTDVEDSSIALWAAEEKLHLFIGLLVGLRFGGASPQKIREKMAFMTNRQD